MSKKQHVKATDKQILENTCSQYFKELRPGTTEVFTMMIEWIAKHDPDSHHAALYTTWIHFEGVCRDYGRPPWLIKAKKEEAINLMFKLIQGGKGSDGGAA